MPILGLLLIARSRWEPWKLCRTVLAAARAKETTRKPEPLVQTVT